MFACTTVKTIRSHYTVLNGVLHVYYDNESEFAASLDILTDPKESKNEESKEEASNNFVSLNFTYHNKSSHPHTILFSIMKSDKDTLMIRLANNKDKFISLLFPKTIVITSSEIAKQTMDISLLRVKSDKYLSDENLITMSKKLLEHFSTVAKSLLSSSAPEKSATDVLIKIINLLKLEKDEFANIIAINREEHSFDTPLTPSPMSK